MSSPRQRIANRRNALRSKGPKTEAGKRRSAINATAHGLTVPIDSSAWAPLLEPLSELILADGFSPAQARTLSRCILEYERNLAYQRKRLTAERGGEGSTKDRLPRDPWVGYEEFQIAGLFNAAIRRPKESKKTNYLGFGKEAAFGLRTFFRQLGARKVREALRDERRTLRNADRYLRRVANQLIRACRAIEQERTAIGADSSVGG